MITCAAAFSQVLNLRFSQLYSGKACTTLSNLALKNVLQSSYLSISKLSSSNFISDMSLGFDKVQIGINGLLRIGISSINLFMIFTALVIPRSTNIIVFLSGIAIIYLSLFKISSQRISDCATVNVNTNRDLIKNLRDSIDNIELLKINCLEKQAVKTNDKHSTTLRRNFALIITGYGQSPRFVIQASILVLLVIAAAAQFSNLNINEKSLALSSFLTALVGVFRMITPIQGIYLSLTKVKESNQYAKNLIVYLSTQRISSS